MTCKVVPQSGKQVLVWDQKQQVLKCFLKSAPEKNKANEELIALLAQNLGLAKSLLAIVGGMTQRRKVIAIDADVSLEECYRRLGLEAVAGLQQQRIG
jgi:uncharacterized protein